MDPLQKASSSPERAYPLATDTEEEDYTYSSQGEKKNARARDA